MYLDTMKSIATKTWRRLMLAVNFFTAKGVMSEASALTYSTLLAVVPIMAVVFAVARGFGYSKYIEVWFRDAFSSQPAVADTLIGFVDSYLIHTRSGVFLGVGHRLSGHALPLPNSRRADVGIELLPCHHCRTFTADGCTDSYSENTDKHDSVHRHVADVYRTLCLRA